MRNPCKQESVLVCNLEHCYNIRNGSVMFYSFDVKEFFFQNFHKILLSMRSSKRKKLLSHWQ